MDVKQSKERVGDANDVPPTWFHGKEKERGTQSRPTYTILLGGEGEAMKFSC